MKRLKKKANTKIKKIYIKGLFTPYIYNLVIVIIINLMFMPGADKSQVTKFKQGSITPKLLN